VSGTVDVLVVGAGPAGSALACLLVEAGLSVEVLERGAHPRPKACGELINPGAVQVLARLGLLEPILALGPAHLEGWRLSTDSAHRALGRYRSGCSGLSVARDRLDLTLASEAVARGAKLRERVRVRRVHTGSGTTLPRVETIEADGRPNLRSARLIVGADGLRSMVSAGINEARPSTSIMKVSLTCRVRGRLSQPEYGRLYISDRGTVGASSVCADGSELNVTVVADSRQAGRQIAADPLAYFEERLAEAALDWLEDPVVTDGPWASGPFDRPVRRVVSEGVLLVGDAAGYFDPLTGQGLFRAFRGAELAASHVAPWLRTRAGVPGRRELAAYARRLRRAFRTGRAMQRIVEAVVSRPAPRRRAIRGLAASPAASDRLIRLTGDVASITSLLRPSLVTTVLGLGRPG
jgi:flavin-dependent dehydrogenase